MCQEFNNIIKKFREIKKLNYVESINNDFNGIGLTFEKLIGRYFFISRLWRNRNKNNFKDNWISNCFI